MMPSMLVWARKGAMIMPPYQAGARGHAWAAANASAAPAALGRPAPLPMPSSALYGTRVTQLIYGQVHLYPHMVDAGLLLSAQQRDVVLWNALFSPVALQQVSAVQDAGAQLAGFHPQTLAPTQELRGTLHITAQGAAQQHSVFTFKTSQGSLSLTVTASRVLQFPFWPDWNASLRLGYAFDTVIARADNGTEQRRPLATRPLRSLHASVWGHSLSGQRLRHCLQRGKDRVFGVPLWMETVSVIGIDAAGHVLTLGEDLSTRWNLTRLCDLVMIYDSRNDTSAAVSVRHVDTAKRTVTLTQPLSGKPHPDSTHLIPLFLGMLTSAEPTGCTDDLELWNVSFRELGGSQPPLRLPASQPASADSSELAPDAPLLWAHQPDWSEPPSGGLHLVRTLRDVRGGVTELGRLRAVAPAVLNQQYLVHKEQLAALLDSVTRLRGRWGTVRLDDPRPAFTLSAPAKAQETTLRVHDNGFLETYDPATLEAHPLTLWIIPDPDTSSGLSAPSKRLRRRVLGAERGRVGECLLQLDQPHGCAMAERALVGREYRVRLDADTLELRWITTDTARCSLSFQELA